MPDYPCASAEVFYNMPLSLRHTGDAEFVYWDTTSNLGGDGIEESDEFSRLAFELFDRLRREQGIPEINDIHEHILNPSTSFDNPRCDRTLEFALAYPPLVSPLIIDSVQSELLWKYPHWRLVLCYETPEDSLAIYPDVVSIGSQQAAVLSQSQWSTWHDGISKRWQQAYGPMRRQFAYVKSRVSRLTAGGLPPISIVGVFDNRQGDHKYDHLWLLTKPSGNQRYVVRSPSGVAHGETYAISEAGEIGMRFEAAGPNRSGLIESWVYVSPKQDIELVIGDGELQWRCCVDLDSIISDQELWSDHADETREWLIALR